jgi:hypothetical protein
MIGLKWMKKVIPLHPTRRGYFFHFKNGCAAMAKEKTGRIGWKRVRWADSALAADGRPISGQGNNRPAG